VHELLTGSRPFWHESREELFKQILNKPLEIADGVSPEAAQVITALLEKDPSQRATFNSLKTLSWFASTDWDALDKISPPQELSMRGNLGGGTLPSTQDPFAGF